MEALRSDSVHTTDSIRSLSCINAHHIDELSKEKEDELLYGGDDADEEDALSDDSMRLRLSDDDEAEPDDILTSILDNKRDKPEIEKMEVTCGKNEDVRAFPVPEKNETKNDTTPSREIQEEEHCSGNVSMGDKVLTHHAKDTKRNLNGLMRPQMINVMPRYPWPNYEFQWRFASTPYGRFPHVNHFPYIRHRYSTPRGQFRNPYDYNTRFHNAFVPFEKRRGNAVFNSFNKSKDYREDTRTFKPSPMKRFNTKSDVDQTVMSPSDAKSSRTEADTSIKDESCAIKNEIEINRELVSETPIGSEQNNDDSSKSPIEISEDNNIEDLKDSLELENETKNAHGNSKNLSDAECKDNDAESKDNDAESKDKTDMLNESSNREITSPLTNAQDESEEGIEEKENTDTDNAQLDCNGSQSSSNYNILAKLLANGPKNSFNDEDVEFIEVANENNKKDNATTKTANLDLGESKEAEQACQAEDHEVTMNQQCIEITETIEVIENHPLEESIKNNDELEVIEKVTCHEEEILTDKNDASIQDTESNEIVETHTPKMNDSILDDSNNREDSKEIEVKENNTIFEPLVNGEKCDKDRLNYSDNSTNTSKLLELLVSDDRLINTKLQERNNSVTEEDVKSVNKGSPITNFSAQTENKVSILDENDLSSVELQNDSLGLTTKVMDSDASEKKVEAPVNTQRRRRRTKKMIAAAQEAVSEEVKESGRQKRKTAQNAEEIIRKKFLNQESDVESSDSSEKFVIINHKVNQDARSLSPPSLKRSCSDLDNIIVNGSVKKIKVNNDSLSDELSSKENDSENIKQLDYVHKFFQRDLKEKLPKLTQEELEELLIQKIVETITMRGEIGKLREQARISERNQEVTRAKCQQLAKQIKDFEMVLSRNAADRRANNDKPVPPIKINRSVGLQVNFITDHGMQCLRQLQQNTSIKSANVPTNSNTPLNTSATETALNISTSPRRGVKVRPPRRVETVATPNVAVSQSHTQSPNIIPTITPAALVVTKPMEAPHTLQLPNQPNVQQMISGSPLPPQQPQQAIVLNGKFTNQLSRQNTSVNITKPRTNDLIDLTDEEEKSKGATSTPVVTTTITEQQISLAQKTQTCFQRVIQTIPGNVAITNQPPSIRVVQPASQPTPTALVNNMSAPRLAYVMQSGVGPRLLQISQNPTTMRPVTSCNRTTFPTLTYKGISTVANGSVRVLTTPAPSNIQLNKHPAPLPDTRNYAMNNPVWKLPPPAPSLKISKVANGIVLSWNMNLSDKYADIVSYQLYAYQEVAGIPPNTSLWKKVGDVRALPLPMACTLTQVIRIVVILRLLYLLLLVIFISIIYLHSFPKAIIITSQFEQLTHIPEKDNIVHLAIFLYKIYDQY
ncbi:fibronectin-III type domain-containing protein windei isoform X2 [Halictus rubicundus]|uniref:fibronectin-III type domain-containing protein windei isoform X2 n=1 Tax=Halictus rubicundus TaxID=77578 RepID=UPI004036E4A6